LAAKSAGFPSDVIKKLLAFLSANKSIESPILVGKRIYVF